MCFMWQLYVYISMCLCDNCTYTSVCVYVIRVRIHQYVFMWQLYVYISMCLCDNCTYTSVCVYVTIVRIHQYVYHVTSVRIHQYVCYVTIVRIHRYVTYVANVRIHQYVTYVATVRIHRYVTSVRIHQYPRITADLHSHNHQIIQEYWQIRKWCYTDTVICSSLFENVYLLFTLDNIILTHNETNIQIIASWVDRLCSKNVTQTHHVLLKCLMF